MTTKHFFHMTRPSTHVFFPDGWLSFWLFSGLLVLLLIVFVSTDQANTLRSPGKASCFEHLGQNHMEVQVQRPPHCVACRTLWRKSNRRVIFVISNLGCSIKVIAVLTLTDQDFSQTRTKVSGHFGPLQPQLGEASLGEIRGTDWPWCTCWA